MPSKIVLLLLGALVLGPVSGTYPFVEMALNLELLARADEKACEQSVLERVEALCGKCVPGFDLADLKCPRDISDMEIMKNCCPQLIQTTTPIIITGPLILVPISNGTTELDKSVIVTDGL
ncbi:unnamed protein product [Caenorhabditis sp. 36 PRJEB53466]|nr:unnamed protein product [Caenorhabditis sp. 36 PRJEB53466]